jgi:DMSO/TMAO reductase YedYZ molybdopterin-dependent catalytic subunit
MKTDIDRNRRRFLVTSAGGAAAAGLGSVAPAAFAQGKPLPPVAAWKDINRLIVHSANGLETRRSAFGDGVLTDNEVLFLRNNLGAPSADIMANADAWRVEIDGVTSPRSVTVGELKTMGLETVPMVLQCSGNGRGFFAHKASGSQWKVGAAGCSLWTGVPMKAVVDALGGVRQGMRYMTSTGGEVIPPGIEPKKVMVERSVPWSVIDRAILAWELNGQPLPLAHGGPLRVIIPGYYGVNNVKYVKRVAFTENETGANIQASGYRVRPIGQKGAPTQSTMWEMNLKSFVTSPAGDETVRAGVVQIHGVAFSGASAVKAVEVSVDGGATWRTANFSGPLLGPYAWRRFVLPLRLSAGDYAITSRAIAYDGAVQPENRVENERAYAHNGWRDHAVKVKVA